MQYLTFKIIVEDVIQKLVNESKFLKSFDYGEITDLTHPKDIDYPRLYMEFPLVEYHNSEEVYSIGLHFIDRGDEAKNKNRTNILSKLKQIGEMFVMRIHETTDLIPEDEHMDMLFYEEKGDDRVYGVRFGIKLQQQWDWSLCELPFNDDDPTVTGVEEPYDINNFNDSDGE